MMQMTLDQYRDAYREMRCRDEKRGFRSHLTVYMCVIPILTTVNLVFVPQFFWFFFPLLGWGLGLTVHYVFGCRRLEETLKREDERIRKYAVESRGVLS
jgi:hypothetical protein